MAHVHRRIQRQGNLMKHGAEQPSLSVGHPEYRIGNIVFRLPLPVTIGPVLRIVVATGGNELQVVTIGDFVFVDFKGWNCSGFAVRIRCPIRKYRWIPAALLSRYLRESLTSLVQSEPTPRPV